MSQSVSYIWNGRTCFYQSVRYVKIFQCDFTLNFPPYSEGWVSFHTFNGNLSFPFCEVSVLVFYPFFLVLCLLLIHKCSLYTFDITFITWMCCKYVSLPSWWQVFYEIFWWTSVLNFNVVQLTNLLFYSLYILCLKKTFPTPGSWIFSPILFSKIFIILPFTLDFLIHLENV